MASYLRTNIQPLMQTGEPMELRDIIHRVTIRKPTLVQHIGKQQLRHLLQDMLDFIQ